MHTTPILASGTINMPGPHILFYKLTFSCLRWFFPQNHHTSLYELIRVYGRNQHFRLNHGSKPFYCTVQYLTKIICVYHHVYEIVFVCIQTLMHPCSDGKGNPLKQMWLWRSWEYSLISDALGGFSCSNLQWVCFCLNRTTLDCASDFRCSNSCFPFRYQNTSKK